MLVLFAIVACRSEWNCLCLPSQRHSFIPTESRLFTHGASKPSVVCTNKLYKLQKLLKDTHSGTSSEYLPVPPSIFFFFPGRNETFREPQSRLTLEAK